MGDRFDFDSDVWSLGVTLHHVLTGAGIYGPMPATDGLLAVRRLLSTPPRISDSLTAPARELIDGCLAPAGHRPSAAALAQRIDTLAGAR